MVEGRGEGGWSRLAPLPPCASPPSHGAAPGTHKRTNISGDYSIFHGLHIFNLSFFFIYLFFLSEFQVQVQVGSVLVDPAPHQVQGTANTHTYTHKHTHKHRSPFHRLKKTQKGQFHIFFPELLFFPLFLSSVVSVRSGQIRSGQQVLGQHV